MATRNSNGLRKRTTKRIICPSPKCHAKNEVIIGNRDNGDKDAWSETKEIRCRGPKCGRMIKFRVNGHGKVKVII